MSTRALGDGKLTGNALATLHEAANRAKTLPYMPLPTQPVPAPPSKYDDPADD